MPNTFNPLGKATGVTLSGGDLVATAASGAAFASSVRSNFIAPAGGGYVEFTPTNQSFAFIGVCDNSFNVSLDSLWYSTHAIGWSPQSGEVRRNGTLTSIQNATTGQISCIAFNSTNIWIRRQNGNWNNSGTADPATNTGGIAHGLTGDLYFAVQLGNAGNSVTAAFASGSWAYVVPSGFGVLVDLPVDARVSQQFVVVAHETDPPQNQVQARVSQQYIIVAHSPTAEPPSGAFRYHQPIINLDDGP